MNEFRRLIAGPEPLYAPLVFNPVSALLAQAAGFRALYLGGGSMGYIKAGTEANLSLTEMAQAALDIRTVCPLPLILDGAGVKQMALQSSFLPALREYGLAPQDAAEEQLLANALQRLGLLDRYSDAGEATYVRHVI